MINMNETNKPTSLRAWFLNLPADWRRLVTILLVMVAASASGFTVDEIRELQKLGFSNEQIVALQGKQPDALAANGQGEVSPTPALECVNAARMQQARDRGNGVLVVCFSKEWVNRGPGFLYFDRKLPDGKWGPIGQSPAVGFTTTGEFGPPRIEHVRQVIKENRRDDKHHGNKDNKNNKDSKDQKGKKDDKKQDGHGGGECERIIEKTIIHPRPLIASRYYAEFELPPGQYDVQSERKFFTGDNEEGSFFKEKRTRTLWNVPVVIGQATVLSYCWGPNDSFGKDHFESPRHLAWIEEVSGKFRPLLTTIKR